MQSHRHPSNCSSWDCDAKKVSKISLQKAARINIQVQSSIHCAVLIEMKSKRRMGINVVGYFSKHYKCTVTFSSGSLVIVIFLLTTYVLYHLLFMYFTTVFLFSPPCNFKTLKLSFYSVFFISLTFLFVISGGGSEIIRITGK